MQVERLRLVGFKSFVDPTELTIAPGLTGIVGPNGCGKSNLVEALHWVMGEASAKRLRGGEMDDVIFAGSGGRPARNIAEVTLTLDNSGRDGPLTLNDRDAIEIGRRLERSSGSSYRINGREARARDVQLLFADAATGPHSGALIGQGRIAALINAKPSERRILLDDAAGTAGMHARRHEAELKLRAAEDNLVRLDDVIATLAGQLDGLRKQARLAQRYRRLGEQIRRAEAQLLDSRWHGAEAEAEAVATELRAAERAVAETMEHALAESRDRAEAEEALPASRLEEAAAAAAVQRMTRAREALEQELVRTVAARGEAERLLGQLAADMAREDANLADGDAALSRLASERQALEHSESRDAAARGEAAARLEQATARLTDAETGLLQMTEACATGEARRSALDRQCRELAERRTRLQARLADGERQLAALAGESVPPRASAAAKAAVSAAVAAIETARAVIAARTEHLSRCQATEAEAADLALTAGHALARLKAEADALASLLTAAESSGDNSAIPSMLSQLRVPEGLEAAVAALCEGELSAPLIAAADGTAEPASAGWVELEPIASVTPLPDPVHRLIDDIGAPAALTRLLAQAGWVDSEDLGWQLQPRLSPGQSLVDRDGRLWRWDGFIRLAAGPSAAAQQLRHRNRLGSLAEEVAIAKAASERAVADAATARAERASAAASEHAAVAALRAGEESLSRARAGEAELTRRAIEAETRLTALGEAVDKFRAELDDIAAQADETDRAITMLPTASLARAGLDAARAQATSARRHEAEARSALDRLAQESAARHRRLDSILGEEGAWRRRHSGAAAQHATLVERRAALDRQIAEMNARPAVIAAESETLTQIGARAAAEHRAAADALTAAETRLRVASDGARRADIASAEARERCARLEARHDGAVEMLARLRAEIAERLGGVPEDLAELAEREAEAAPADQVEATTRLDRLLRERAAMGPINLVAEAETEEVEARVGGLTGERAELTEAIARLRRGIGALDQEGRKRVVAAFELLNAHFSELFTRLFGGGKAHLAFADDSDPLEAGLEIMASPPGKRLQALSLLSGGEQALTAIALIFAVFLTNPAPICVLDEVDAALDDANVDRFCRLVAEIADATGTRFLLVTHHRITMARMDRLFGVTMPERGVSQLVSVDLARAAELRQTA